MSNNKSCKGDEEIMELRRGPWTLEEDTLLIHYIACHGEGRWNLLARCSGLKRTGKSCRLRWLNYLKPDVKRGNLTPEEQILILELHSKWGNRWSRIAQHLPGRTDNEIKNYWRTRVQKQAKQLKVDANSDVFRDAVRCFWMPRLMEKMGASQPSQLSPLPSTPSTHTLMSTELNASQFVALDSEFGTKINNGDAPIDGVAYGLELEGSIRNGLTLTHEAGASGSMNSGSGCTTILGHGWEDGVWNNIDGDVQMWNTRHVHEYWGI